MANQGTIDAKSKGLRNQPSETQIYGQIEAPEFNQKTNTRAQTTEKHGRRQRKLTGVEFENDKENKANFASQKGDEPIQSTNEMKLLKGPNDKTNSIYTSTLYSQHFVKK